MELSELQKKVHVAKDKHNKFGGYNYRTAEGILSAIKAVMDDGDSIVLFDELQDCAGQIFVKATAKYTSGAQPAETSTGYALHPLTKKGMDPSQITGAASSYARKYALSGLLALDDASADPDAKESAYEAETPTQDPAPEPTQKPTENEISSAVQAINNCRTIDGLSGVWSMLYTNKRYVADDPTVISAKNSRKAALVSVTS